MRLGLTPLIPCGKLSPPFILKLRLFGDGYNILSEYFIEVPLPKDLDRCEWKDLQLDVELAAFNGSIGLAVAFERSRERESIAKELSDAGYTKMAECLLTYSKAIAGEVKPA